MRIIIYQSQHATAAFSTEHAASSYGIPVLTVNGEAYGPSDALPSGISAAALVELALSGGAESGGGFPALDDGGRLACQQFLSSGGPMRASA